MSSINPAWATQRGPFSPLHSPTMPWPIKKLENKKAEDDIPHSISQKPLLAFLIDSCVPGPGHRALGMNHLIIVAIITKTPVTSLPLPHIRKLRHKREEINVTKNKGPCTVLGPQLRRKEQLLFTTQGTTQVGPKALSSAHRATYPSSRQQRSWKEGIRATSQSSVYI